MGAVGLIKIDSASLSGLEGRMTTLTQTDFESATVLLKGAPDVDAKYDDFVRRWDDKRKELFEQLDTVTKMVKGIREAFEQTDSDLACAVQGEGEAAP